MAETLHQKLLADAIRNRALERMMVRHEARGGSEATELFQEEVDREVQDLEEHWVADVKEEHGDDLEALGASARRVRSAAQQVKQHIYSRGD